MAEVQKAHDLPPAPAPPTAEEKAAAERNLEALKPQHTLYVKIQTYGSVAADQADAVLKASEVFLEALTKAKLSPTKADITVTPPTEAQAKQAAEETRKAEAKAKAEEKVTH